MSRFIDLAGKTFGRLKVIKLDTEKNTPQKYWICECSCGKTKSILGDSLRRGKTRSCGCYAKERVSETNWRNLTGVREKDFTIVSPTEERGSGGCIIWECQNSSGEKFLRESRYLEAEKLNI